MTTMAGLQAAAALTTFSFSSSSSSKLSISNPHIPISTLPLARNFPLYPLTNPSKRRLISALCSVAEEETALKGKTVKTQQPTNAKRKLFVLNLPWSLTVADIKELFGQCGTVSDVEIIKQKDGKNRGFAFVTMASGEEAQAAVDKFDSHQVSGRIIRVDFARRFKKPSPSPPPTIPSSKETRHQLYVSNLAWKVRSTHLREFFSAADFNPVSARVVFESPEGKAAGYGFVSFATMEEAAAAISALNGKELMGRPIRLKFNEKNVDQSESENVGEESISKGQPGE